MSSPRLLVNFFSSRFSRRSRLVWGSSIQWQRRILFLAGAILVGLVSVGFAISANSANHIFHQLLERAWWSPLLIVPAGFACIRWITQRWFPGTQGSGIPQTMAALQNSYQPDSTWRHSLLSLRTAFGKILLTLGGLMCGAPIGREGPSVQVGAAIMFSLSRFAAFPSATMQRGLILAGSAAGMAAAFNAPLAGVVFAIEEMSRSFEQRTTSIVLTAVVTAGIVALALQGNYAYFGQSYSTLDIKNGFFAVALCGTLGGLCGGGFSRILLQFNEALPGRLQSWRGRWPILFAAGCGLLIGLLGVISQQSIYGTGYEEAHSLLNGESASTSFGPLKLLATVISYASGIPGGIFAPSLAVGSGLGYDIATLLPQAPLQAVVILGMVSYFSGVVQAPLTAFVIVLEMTRDSQMALPLMTCSLLAYLLSRIVCPTPLYKGLSQSFLSQLR